MIIDRRRPVLPLAEAGHFAEPVTGALLTRQADAIAWLGAYRARPCAWHQVARLDAELAATPLGVTEDHEVIWTASPLVSRYFVQFAYQATRLAQSASERLHVAAGIQVDATLRQHAGGGLVDGAPAVRWSVGTGTLQTKAETTTVWVFGDDIVTSVHYPVIWATSTVRVDDAPAAFPSRPRLLNAAGEGGNVLRLELEALNVRILAVRIFEVPGGD